jgi:poly(A) polymerase
MEEELLVLFTTVGKMYDETLAAVLHGPRLLTGKDLIRECKLTPGPLFSEIMDELETARAEGKVVDRKTAIAWVNDYLQEKNSQGHLG